MTLRRALGTRLEEPAKTLADFVAFLNRLDAEFITSELALRWEVKLQSDVMTRLGERQVRGDPPGRRGRGGAAERPGGLAQHLRVVRGREQGKALRAQHRLLRRQRAAGEQRLRLVLALGHVGLVERVDLQHRAHRRGGDLPAQEFACDLRRRR